MEKVWGVIVTAAIVIIVAWIVIVAFSGNLYAVVNNVLNWNVTLSEDERIANENAAKLNSVYNFYSRCLDSKKVNCTCRDNIYIQLGDGQIVIQGIESSIKMFSMVNDDVINIKTLNGNHCYISSMLDVNKPVDNSEVKIHSVNGELVLGGIGEFVGNIANPLVLYKWNRDGKNYLCMPRSQLVASEIDGKSCF